MRNSFLYISTGIKPESRNYTILSNYCLVLRNLTEEPLHLFGLRKEISPFKGIYLGEVTIKVVIFRLPQHFWQSNQIIPYHSRG
jgi:hypothetical protein